LCCHRCARLFAGHKAVYTIPRVEDCNAFGRVDAIYLAA
jgi:hypothetical protein